MVIEATVTEKIAKVFIVTFVTLPKGDSKYLYFFPVAQTLQLQLSHISEC